MKSSRISSLPALGALALAFSFASTAQAATITWGAATTISGDGNVQNTGTTVGAFSVGSTGVPSTTVNGVTFAPMAFADGSNTTTVGNFALNMNSAIASNTGFGTTAAPFSNLSTNYKSLLQSGAFSDRNRINLTMNGLNVGTNYSFQWWANNSGNFTSYGYQQVRATSGNSVTIVANTSGSQSTDGALGQFAIGTFTADSTSQTINFVSPNDSAILNAFQLRTAVAPVPEPSTYAMMALGLGALCLITRKRRQSDSPA